MVEKRSASERAADIRRKAERRDRPVPHRAIPSDEPADQTVCGTCGVSIVETSRGVRVHQDDVEVRRRKVAVSMATRGMVVVVRPTSVGTTHYAAEVFDGAFTSVWSGVGETAGDAYDKTVDSVPWSVIESEEETK